jgi:hypothetical protein
MVPRLAVRWLLDVQGHVCGGGMRLPRIDRVDAPLHLAARTQDWLGQAAFDQFLAVRAGHETQAELVPLRLRTGGTGSSPERAESTAASWAHPREASAPATTS